MPVKGIKLVSQWDKLQSFYDQNVPHYLLMTILKFVQLIQSCSINKFDRKLIRLKFAECYS